MAAQDQDSNIRYYHIHIMWQGSIDKCRMCHSQPETVEHVTSRCQTLAVEKYIKRHKQVATQLHLEICKHYDIKVFNTGITTIQN